MNATEQLQANFYTIGVKFLKDLGYGAGHEYGNKVYTYKVPNDVVFEVGDFAVVRVEGKEPELKLVKVFEVNDCSANFRYAVLGIFIVAAVITPTPDSATQSVFAVPMIGLYLLGVMVAWIFGKKPVGDES